MHSLYAVIMAGGGGTRLWPLSRQARPKQALPLLGERTLFQMTLDRVRPLVAPEQVLVVTIADQADLLRSQAPELPVDQFVLEPAPRGTASVIGLAALLIRRKDRNAVMACLPADHYIRDEVAFREVLLAAHDLAQEGDLVTLGIQPTYPATGYGYIRMGESRGEYRGHSCYRALSFTEKPDAATARKYVDVGDSVWNAGIFVWRADRILEEIRTHMPSLHRGLQEIRRSLGTDEEQEVLDRVWEGLAPETIDYGVMEKADAVSVIPSERLGWQDIGGWDRLLEVLEADPMGNVVVAPEAITVDTTGTLLYQSQSDPSRRLIATLGLENLIVVDAGDVLLVARRDRAEEVRKLVDMLAERGLGRYL